VWRAHQRSFTITKKSLVAHQHQKFRVIRQVFDEKLSAWTAIDPAVTKNFL